LGLAAWFLRSRLAFLTVLLRPFAWAAQRSFGFEAVNRAVAATIAAAGEDLRATQTGLLNWNILAILGGLLFVIFVLVVGK